MSDGVALVTGASRGLGRGIAIGLAETGLTVVITARSGNGLAETVAGCEQAGGRAVAVVCDHRDDQAVAGVFERISSDWGRLDLLVNNATNYPDVRTIFTPTPFWQIPTSLWDDLLSVGLRSHFIAAQHAALLMIAQGGGLIVNVSSSAAAVSVPAVLPYGVGKAALDRMTSDMATDLSTWGVTALGVWPPPSSTEGMLAAAETDDEVRAWSLPVFTGRVIAAVRTDPGLADRAGRVFRVRELAAEFGIEDQTYPGR